MNETGPLDAAVFTKLQSLGGVEFVREMIDIFFAYAPEKIAEARAALTTGDREAVAKAVHPLKSSAGHIGAQRLLLLATEIEEHAREYPLAALELRISELEKAHAAVVPELQKVRQSLG
jgi:HPt (histidine-containing phosphotransfer) domain-containing protein